MTEEIRIGARHDADCCCEQCVCEKEARDGEIRRVVQAARQLVSGAPVPEDGSHTTLKPNGQQQDYVVLSPEERAKGFVKPVRRSYVHNKCGVETTMGTSIAETYARDPNFYSGTFCVGCRSHFPLHQFTWCDGEPMHPPMQAAWADEQARKREERRLARIDELRRELATLEAAAPDHRETLDIPTFLRRGND